MLHNTERTTGLQNRVGIGQGRRQEPAFGLETCKVVQDAREKHDVRCAVHLSGHRTEVECRERCTRIATPFLGTSRPVGDPGALPLHEFFGGKGEVRPHVHRVVRTNQVPLGAEVR